MKYSQQRLNAVHSLFKEGFGLESMWDYIISKAQASGGSFNSLSLETAESQLDGLYFKLDSNPISSNPN